MQSHFRNGFCLFELGLLWDRRHINKGVLCKGEAQLGAKSPAARRPLRNAIVGREVWTPCMRLCVRGV